MLLPDRPRGCCHRLPSSGNLTNMSNRRLALLFLPFLLSSIFAADWPQYRGPNRNGISTETGLMDSWPASGPPLVWKTQGLGEGYSSFAVVGDRLYTQGQRGSDQFVLALDAKTASNSGRRRPERPLETTGEAALAEHRPSTETAYMRWPRTVLWCAWTPPPAN